MDKKHELLKLIPEQGVLPLYFFEDTEVSLRVLKTLYKAGIRAVEYTNRGKAALANFQQMREMCNSELPGMYLGIGTIKNEVAAKTFIDAGADFIICPGLIEEVAYVADKDNLLWIPGCMTPSEIIRAQNLGAGMIKLFPGNILGAEFMNAIKVLFPDLLFIPTGGVDINRENIAGWFNAGVCAVGLGSKLISKQLLEKKDYTGIELLVKEIMAMTKTVR